MISVFYDWNDMEISITGHAGSDVPGKDLVCCAVSTLFEALRYSAETQTSVIERYDCRHETGDSYIRIYPTPIGEGPARWRFSACLEGIRMLSQAYPEYIEMSGG